MSKFRLLAALIPALACSGCLVLPWGETDLSQFSPDGSRVAFTRTEGLGWVTVLGMFGPSGTLVAGCEIRWRDSQPPDAPLRAVRVDTACLKWPNPARLAFSPDSRRLAAASGWHIVVIDLDTRKHRQVSSRPEWVNCLFWSGPEELVYVTVENVHGQDENRRCDRTVWRQGIGHGAAPRTAILTDKDITADHPLWAKEEHPGSRSGYDFARPSPCGTYLVLVSERENGRFLLVDARTGATRELGPCWKFEDNIAWRPDGSAVFCHSAGGPAILAHTRCGTVRQRTGEDMGHVLRSQSDVEPLWTADNRFVIINGQNGGCLLDPETWEVIRLGERVLDRWRPRESWYRPRPLEWSPLPGCVVAQAPDSNAYIADYEGRLLAPAGKFSAWYWRWSPDGRYAGTVDDNGRRVTVLTAEELARQPQ